MNLPFYIARRYLFSKKSHNAINVISMVSVCGVAVATMAMVCALSVFNGFSDLTSLLFSFFDPELKITPQTGKVFDPTTPAMREVAALPDILSISEVLQDNALVQYRDRQEIITLKGVDDRYGEATRIDSVLIEGEFLLREDVVDYATLGVGLAAALGVRAGYVSPLEIYAPKRDERFNSVNPAASLNMESAMIGGLYSISQVKYDEGFMIVSLDLARSLFRYEKEVSALEIKVKEESRLDEVKGQIKRLLGEGYHVEDRYEQQADSFKMMQIEKWITFLFLCFVLAIALFNMVGSLSMLMIEKQEDVRTLRNMGANNQLIRQIFLLEGFMISSVGIVIGILLGITLTLLQQYFGLITLGQQAGAFIIDAYPVRLVLSDLLIVSVAVMGMSLLVSWYAVRYLGKRWLSQV